MDQNNNMDDDDPLTNICVSVWDEQDQLSALTAALLQRCRSSSNTNAAVKSDSHTTPASTSTSTSNALQEDDSDSSSCSSSVEEDNITIMGGGTSDTGHQNKGVIMHIIFLRNCMICFIFVMGVALSAGTHICLSRLSNMQESTLEKVSLVVRIVSSP